MESEEPAAKRARGWGGSMEAEVPDSCTGAAQEPMEDDAEDRMEKQKRAPGWEDFAERTKRPRKDDDEDTLLEVACQDDFDEAGWAEEYVDGQEVAEEFNDDRSGKKLDPKKVRQARDEELVELERRVYVEADVGECGRQGLRRLPEQARRKGFQAEEQDRRPRGTLRSDPRRWRS